MKLFSLLLLVVHLVGAELPYIVTDLLPSLDEIEQKNSAFSTFAEQKLGLFVKASGEKQFDVAYDAWSDACEAFFNLQLLYYQTISLSSNVILKGYIGSHLAELHQLFRKQIQSKVIVDQFIANGLEAELLTPFQRSLTKKVLESAYNPDPKSLETIERYKECNFVYHEIEDGKKASIGNRFSVLTVNVLCFPDPFCYFFGGVFPWESRVEKIAEKIISKKADVVCLQEVWDKNIASHLIEKLKTEYSYFIYDAGNQHGTLNPEEIGLNSGLFVASKVPFNSMTFVPFADMKPIKGGIKRGALQLKFVVGNQEWTCVATHLQHGQDEESVAIRVKQFNECSELLGLDRGFILGDLNINAFSDEFLNSALFSDFFISYLQGKLSISEQNATATDYFNDLTHTLPDQRELVVPTFELLDYCIIRKHTNMKLLIQERIPFFSIKDPLHALSDHHGLLTVWQIH